MKNFIIVNLNNFKFQCIVIANSYKNPLEDLEDIETSLKNKKYKGHIIFDLLACLGDSSNRFITCYFDGNNFDLVTFEETKIEKSDKIRSISRDNLTSQKEILDLTILTSVQKNLLNNGVAL